MHRSGISKTRPKGPEEKREIGEVFSEKDDRQARSQEQRRLDGRIGACPNLALEALVQYSHDYLGPMRPWSPTHMAQLSIGMAFSFRSSNGQGVRE